MSKLSNLKNYLLKHLSMRQKMILSYTVPVILIFFAGMSFAYTRAHRSCMTNIEYSISQTGHQAVSFLESYLQIMNDITEQISSNTVIRGIITDEHFLQEKSSRETYEEYQALYAALEDINTSFPSYRAAVFLPDSVGYTTNRYHIYPLSELQGSSSVTDMDLRLGSGLPVFAFDRERNLSSRLDGTFNALVVYRRILEGGSEPAAAPVSKVSISADVVMSIFSNASIAENEIIMLLDENSRIIFAAEDGEVVVSSDIEDTVSSLFAGEDSSNQHLTPQIVLDGKKYYCLKSDPVRPAEWSLVLAVPASEINRQALQSTAYMLPLFLLVTLSIILLSYVLAKYYTGRLQELSYHMQLLQDGNLNPDYSVMPDSNDEFDRIAGGFNYMTQQIRSLMQEHYRMGKSVKSSELRALQAQINPHFLYNTLDLVNWMAMDFGTIEIAEIAQNLARFYRLSLNHGRSILTIDEEIQHVQAYVNIENYHFSDAIELRVDADPEVLSLGCPNIILQPFVENSIVHGIAEDESITSCRINILVRREGECIVFRIEDDGPGMSQEQICELENATPDQVTKGYGVKNINFRLKLYFGEEFGIHYESTPGKGTRVITTIPAMTVTEMEELIR